MRERRDRPTIIIIMGACGELGKDKRANAPSSIIMGVAVNIIMGA